MGEFRQALVTAILLVLVGIAAHRVVGAASDPFTLIAVWVVLSQGWLRYRRHRSELRRALARLRSYAADDRERMLDSIESERVREELASELRRDGSETNDGVTETFPFPDVFRRRATRRYWRDWLASATAIGIAAFLPALSPIWRLAWLVVGLVLLFRARRFRRWHETVSSVIEINSYRVSFVASDGTRQTISFADSPSYEALSDAQMLLLRSGDVSIGISYALVGFWRISELIVRYGARPPATPDAPAS
jgi:hypothetical protein